MLRELFAIREQRKGEVDISISLSVTEIYNEMIKAISRGACMENGFVDRSK